MAAGSGQSATRSPASRTAPPLVLHGTCDRSNSLRCRGDTGERCSSARILPPTVAIQLKRRQWLGLVISWHGFGVRATSTWRRAMITGRERTAWELHPEMAPQRLETRGSAAEMARPSRRLNRKARPIALNGRFNIHSQLRRDRRTLELLCQRERPGAIWPRNRGSPLPRWSRRRQR
jgi:hypothetical protein